MKTKRIFREWQHPRASNGRFAKKGSPEWVKAAAEKFRNAPHGLKAGTTGPGQGTRTNRPQIARGAKAEALFAKHDASVTTRLGRQPVQGPEAPPKKTARPSTFELGSKSKSASGPDAPPQKKMAAPGARRTVAQDAQKAINAKSVDTPRDSAKTGGMSTTDTPALSEGQRSNYDKLLGSGPGEGLVKHKQSRQIVEQLEQHGWTLQGGAPTVGLMRFKAPDGRELGVQFLVGEYNSKPRFFTGSDARGRDLSYKAALAHVVTPTHEEVGGGGIHSARKRLGLPDIHDNYSDHTLKPFQDAQRAHTGYGTMHGPTKNTAEVAADLRKAAESNRRTADHRAEYNRGIHGQSYAEDENTRLMRQRADEFTAVADEMEKMDRERAAYVAERDRRAALPLDIRPTHRVGPAKPAKKAAAPKTGMEATSDRIAEQRGLGGVEIPLDRKTRTGLSDRALAKADRMAAEQSNPLGADILDKPGTDIRAVVNTIKAVPDSENGATAYSKMDRGTLVVLARQAGISVRGKSNDDLAAALKAKDDARKARLNPKGLGTGSESSTSTGLSPVAAAAAQRATAPKVEAPKAESLPEGVTPAMLTHYMGLSDRDLARQASSSGIDTAGMSKRQIALAVIMHALGFDKRMQERYRHDAGTGRSEDVGNFTTGNRTEIGDVPEPSPRKYQTFADRMRGDMSEADRLAAHAAGDERRRQLRAQEAEHARQRAEAQANDTRTEREKLTDLLQEQRAVRDIDMRSGRVDPKRAARIRAAETRLEEIKTEDRKAKIKSLGVQKGDKVKTALGEFEVTGKTADGYLRVVRPDGRRGSVAPEHVEAVTKVPKTDAISATSTPGNGMSDAEIGNFMQSKGIDPVGVSAEERRDWLQRYEAAFGSVAKPQAQNDASKLADRLRARLRGLELERESADLYGDSIGGDEDERDRAKRVQRKELDDLRARLQEAERAERGFDRTPSRAFAKLSDAALDREIKASRPGTKRAKDLRDERDARAAARFKEARPKADAAKVAAPEAPKAAQIAAKKAELAQARERVTSEYQRGSQGYRSMRAVRSNDAQLRRAGEADRDVKRLERELRQLRGEPEPARPEPLPPKPQTVHDKYGTMTRAEFAALPPTRQREIAAELAAARRDARNGEDGGASFLIGKLGLAPTPAERKVDTRRDSSHTGEVSNAPTTEANVPVTTAKPKSKLTPIQDASLRHLVEQGRKQDGREDYAAQRASAEKYGAPVHTSGDTMAKLEAKGLVEFTKPDGEQFARHVPTEAGRRHVADTSPAGPHVEKKIQLTGTVASVGNRPRTGTWTGEIKADRKERLSDKAFTDHVITLTLTAETGDEARAWGFDDSDRPLQVGDEVMVDTFDRLRRGIVTHVTRDGKGNARVAYATPTGGYVQETTAPHATVWQLVDPAKRPRENKAALLPKAAPEAKARPRGMTDEEKKAKAAAERAAQAERDKKWATDKVTRIRQGWAEREASRAMAEHRGWAHTEYDPALDLSVTDKGLKLIADTIGHKIPTKQADRGNLKEDLIKAILKDVEPVESVHGVQLAEIPDGAEILKRLRRAAAPARQASIPVGANDADRARLRPRKEGESDLAYSVRNAPSDFAAENILKGHNLAGLRAIAREEKVAVPAAATKPQAISVLMEVMRRRDRDSRAVGQYTPPNRAHADLVHPEVPAAPKPKPTEKARTELSGGVRGKTELIEYSDGSKSVRKKIWHSPNADPEEQADVEELTPHIMAVVGIDAPAVRRIAPDTIDMDYVPGKTGMVLSHESNNVSSKAEHLQRQQEIVNHLRSDDAKRIGLADLLIDNYDRNPGNWIIDENGRMRPIDNGAGFETVNLRNVGPPQTMGSIWHDRSMPWDNYGSPTDRAWVDNDLTPADIAEVRRRLFRLRDEFVKRGRTAWYEFMFKRLEQLAPHAKGTRNLIAGGAS